MKNINEIYKKFLDLFTHQVPLKTVYHGEDPFIDKLVNPQKGETKREPDWKRLGALVVGGAILAGGVALGSNKISSIKEDNSPPAQISTMAPTTDTKKPEAINPNNIYISTYNGTKYFFATEEYMLQLSRESLSRVEAMLKSVDGITPVGTSSGSFYPEYFDEYLLTAVAFTESTYRISDTNGNLLESKDGALGLTQVKPSTLNDLNNWLHGTMGLTSVTYTIEDLHDPSKALDITNLLLIKICKNHGKMTSNNPVYPYLNESFTLERQEEIILAIYNNGYDNIMRYINNGIVYDYLKEGSSNNYVNKVLTKKEKLVENHFENPQEN